MPNDLYRWEQGGGLVHHCPICKTPLSHDNCRTRCLGEHVEWCSRYHTQLFRKGWSNECAPCRHSNEQHEKRHREIADLIRQLKEIQKDQTSSPLAHRCTPLMDRVIATPSPLSKKERKQAKKAAKVEAMPKVISTADVEFVAGVLHPHNTEVDEAEEEKHLLSDPDIKLNLYFHKGTSNTRESRRRHIKRKDSHQQYDLDMDELDALMIELEVPTAAQVKTEAEKRLVEAIRKAVSDDMVNVQKEHEQTVMRKAGFWRWASKKAYNRLLANGRIWDQKAGETAETPGRKDSAVSTTQKEDETDEGVDGQLTKVEISTPKKPVISAESPTNYFKASVSAELDGWTTIGKVKLAKKSATGPIKLCSNGGLAKLQVTPKGKFGALGLSGFATQDEDAF